MTDLDPRHQPPDAATLAWVAAQLGSPTASVVRRLGGGLDAATHLVATDDGREAVLRRGTGEQQDWRDTIFRRECDVLGHLRTTGLPVAHLIASDLDAVHTDSPTILVTRLPGRLTYPAQPSRAFVEAIAQTAAEIHAQPVPEPHWPWQDHRERLDWFLADGQNPGWDELRTRGTPTASTVFVHGDLWAGNLLFDGDPDLGTMTGIVDWGTAGVGYAGLEVGHAAAELRIGTDSDAVHDALIDAYERIRGPLDDRAWWEVAGYLVFPRDPADWLPGWVEAGLPLTADDVRQRHAAGLARALDQLR